MSNKHNFSVILATAIGILTVMELEGIEAINRIMKFDLSAEGERSNQENNLCDTGATLQIKSFMTQRAIHGVITVASCKILSNQRYQFTLRFESGLTRLQQCYSRHVFTACSVLNTAQLVLSKTYQPRQIQLRVSQSYPLIPYLLQSPYENDWEFLLGLLNENGLYLFELHSHEQATIVITDDRQHHPQAKMISLHEQSVNSILQTFSGINQHGYRLRTSMLLDGTGVQHRIQNNDTSLKLDRNCLIIQINHSLKQQNSQVYYCSEATLLPAPQGFTIPAIANLPMPLLMPAHTISASTIPEFDEQGQYKIQLDCDHRNNTAVKTLSRIPRVSSSAGKIHLPITGKQLVLVSIIDPAHKQLCISAVIPSGVKPNLVDPQRPHQNRWLTPFGHCIEFNDTPSQNYICLQSPEGYNSLCLHNEGIDLVTQGTLQWQAEKIITLESSRDVLSYIRDSLRLTAAATLQLKTQTGNIEIISQQQIKMLSQHRVDLAAKSVDINTQQNLMLQAKQDINIQAQQASWSSRGKIMFSAKRDLLITGDGCGDITLQQGRSSIRLTASGDIIFQADQINLHAKQKFLCKGKVVISDS